MKKDFRSIVDERLSRLDLESLLVTAAKRNAAAKHRIAQLALAFMLALTGCIFAASGMLNDKTEPSAYLFYPQSFEPAYVEPPGDIPEFYVNNLMVGDAYQMDYNLNMLVLYFNDANARQTAISGLESLAIGGDGLIDDSIRFARGILSGTHEHPDIMRLYDGSVAFTLFHHYAEYGNYNKIWRIKDGVLYEYYGFEKPHLYIAGLFPSPDGTKLAAITRSTTRQWLTIFDFKISAAGPELMESLLYKAALEAEAGWMTTDSFKSYVNGVYWENMDIIRFDASFEPEAETVALTARYSASTGKLGYVE
ncbi:MAG: hypothetical protein LBU32_01440 [Clostridiales bacterium]|nr:hypothetical protein [Clostridiales bacterium]